MTDKSERSSYFPLIEKRYEQPMKYWFSVMEKLKDKIFKLLLFFGLVWVHIALIFDVYMLYLHFTDQEDKMGFIFDKIDNYISIMR